MADRPVAEPSIASSSLDAVRELVDAEIAAFLAERRAELAAMDPAAPALVDEISRLLGAGGKRIRPALCYWAHLAAGGPGDAAIARAASAVELLHTFALIHDDVMDAADARRGVATTHAAFAARAPAGTDPGRFGMAAAILVGDLCAVLAEWMLRTCGAEPGRLALATERFDHMRMAMAAGQLLDVGSAGSPIPRSPVAALKTGSYTGEGPILVATALAGAGPAIEGPLRAYGRLVGEAFQLRDDVLDGDAAAGAARRVGDLVDRAVAAIEGVPLVPQGVAALAELAGLLRLEGR